MQFNSHIFAVVDVTLDRQPFDGDSHKIINVFIMILLLINALPINGIISADKPLKKTTDSSEFSILVMSNCARSFALKKRFCDSAYGTIMLDNVSYSQITSVFVMV